MIENANIVCYFCGASYTKKEHTCTPECCVQGRQVWHFDFCTRCRKILMQYYIRQMGEPNAKA